MKTVIHYQYLKSLHDIDNMHKFKLKLADKMQESNAHFNKRFPEQKC